MNNILVIEDETRVANILKKGLEEQGFEVRIACDGYMGQSLMVNDTFDMIILDVNLPGMNGYEVCRLIRTHNQHIPILMLTALGSKDDKLAGFSSGADDYIVKPFEFKELIARINVFLRRSINTSAATVSKDLEIDDLLLKVDTKMAERAGKKIELTSKEYQLLELLLKNKDVVVSKQKILETIWDMNYDSGSNVVEVFVNYLRKKVDKDFDKKLIKTKPGFGYYISSGDDA